MLLVAAMTGISQPQTLKLFGHIKNMKVTVLIDSGSTHNFIDSRVEKQLKIFIYPTTSFQVSIPRNKTTVCGGKFHKVELDIKDYKIRLTMYAMAIRGLDIVLGAQWLTLFQVHNVFFISIIFNLFICLCFLIFCIHCASTLCLIVFALCLMLFLICNFFLLMLFSCDIFPISYHIAKFQFVIRSMLSKNLIYFPT